MSLEEEACSSARVVTWLMSACWVEISLMRWRSSRISFRGSIFYRFAF